MVEQPPMMEGRRMLMIIAPRGGVISRPATPRDARSSVVAARRAPRPAGAVGLAGAERAASGRAASSPSTARQRRVRRRQAAQPYRVSVKPPAK